MRIVAALVLSLACLHCVAPESESDEEAAVAKVAVDENTTSPQDTKPQDTKTKTKDPAPTKQPYLPVPLNDVLVTSY